MDRQEPRDTVLERMAPCLPGKASDPGRPGRDNRLFVEAVLQLARSGAHCGSCRLPMVAGTLSASVSTAGCRSGVWETLFKALSDDADFEYILVDSTSMVPTPQKAINSSIGLKLTRRDGRNVAYIPGSIPQPTPGQSGTLHPDRRSAQRYHTDRAIARRPRGRPCSGRQGIRWTARDVCHRRDWRKTGCCALHNNSKMAQV